MAYTTNHTLLQKMRDGDESSWVLFREFYRPLIAMRGIDYHLDSNEIDMLIQEVLVACFREHVLTNYDKSKGHFRDYLRTISSRKAQEIIDSRSSDIPLTYQNTPEADDFERKWNEEWKEFITAKAMEEVREAVDSRDMMVFELHVIERRPAKDIAEIFDISVDNVYQISSRITKRLQATALRLESELG